MEKREREREEFVDTAGSNLNIYSEKRNKFVVKDAHQPPVKTPTVMQYTYVNLKDLLISVQKNMSALSKMANLVMKSITYSIFHRVQTFL